MPCPPRGEPRELSFFRTLLIDVRSLWVQKKRPNSSPLPPEMRPPSPPPPWVSLWGRSWGPQCSWPQAAWETAHPAESFPQCCFDRKIRCPEGVSPRAWAPRLLVSVGEIHLEKGAGDSCECKRQFRGWKTSLEFTKCHILLVILIKIAQNILYKFKKKTGKNEYNALSRSEVFTIPVLQMWKPRGY